ncbi:hypothetical protein K6T82_18315 [Flavobacterium sp. 17A]|uniref:Uncharacterized protein n=1 Tax=Flavobacterium potami TaxID=2872310 RepID=A0A9X1HCQ5_9FLAO|nr:hypothetical protein [Flavobacterium potami]MBZ4036731.1 hypothetical protein [Flavobacterium potami]
MESNLPSITIEGTAFLVDVIKQELRENASQQNIIKIKDMLYVGHGYKFQYDTSTKNAATFEAISDFGDTSHIKDVTIPNLADIDPLRTAEKYNLKIEDIKGKSDFELSLKKGSSLHLRVTDKVLPVLKIDGHDFYVDMESDKLRPKDDSNSKGIDFSTISEYYDRTVQAYIIPYNPKTREFQEVDHDAITEIPKEIIMVQFPHQIELDRVGWNMKHGFGPGYAVDENRLQLHFTAETLPWNKTNIPESIARNIEELKTEKNAKTNDPQNPIDLTAYEMRVNKGILPTINIAGHTFYVDIRMDKLRPKDDFLSKGIVFSEIENYYDLDKRCYTIPYNPKTHEFQEPDYRDIKEFPKDLIAVQFPSERLLDRIGWNRHYGFELTHGLAGNGLKLQFTAKRIPWEKTILADVIKSNLKTGKSANENDRKQQSNQQEKSSSKGRKM